MKTLIISSLLLVFVVISLQAQVKVSYDFDKSKDFSQYKTYNYTPHARQLKVDDVVRSRIMYNIDQQMEAKGFTKSDQPDIIVDVQVSLNEKQNASQISDWYGYGVGYSYGWGPSFSASAINIHNYMEGTLFIDLISTSANQLVWQGRGTGTVQERLTAEKRDKRLSKAIAKIFKKYPPK